MRTLERIALLTIIYYRRYIRRYDDSPSILKIIRRNYTIVCHVYFLIDKNSFLLQVTTACRFSEDFVPPDGKLRLLRNAILLGIRDSRNGFPISSNSKLSKDRVL